MARLEANIKEALFDSSMHVRRAIFLTYTFDPAYFSEEIEPELSALGCERFLVLMDAGQYRLLGKSGAPAGLGRLVIGRHKQDQLFHPKVFILAGAGHFRCVIGSANLTKQGFEGNRELFSVITDKDFDRDQPVKLLNAVASRVRPGSSAIRLINETIAELLSITQERNVEDSVSLVTGGLGGQNLLAQLLSSLAGKKPIRGVVMTPYFESADTFDTGLLDTWLRNDMRVDLYVPYQQSQSNVPRDQVKILMKRYPGRLRLYGVPTGHKVLHAKLIAVMNRTRASVLTGSANFTAAAMRGKNVEAGLLFNMTSKNLEDYIHRLLGNARSLTTSELPSPAGRKDSIDECLCGYVVSSVLSTVGDFIDVTLDLPWDQIAPPPTDLLLEINGISVPTPRMALGVTEFRVPGAKSFLQSDDGAWQPGIITVKASDGSAEDWGYIELAPGEYVDEAGEEVEPANDLATFVSSLTNARAAIRPWRKLPEPLGPLPPRPHGVELNKLEAGLDRAYRYSVAIEVHFSRKMSDHYTVYRWQFDWLRVSDLLSRNTDGIPPSGLSLVASRMLRCLEVCLAGPPPASKDWFLQNNEISAPTDFLLGLVTGVAGMEFPRIRSRMKTGEL